MRTHYRFGSEWVVHAHPDSVRALLADVPGYSAWWPGVTVLDDLSSDGRRAARIEVRAPLGYRIRCSITEAVGDDEELRVVIGGDLEGWAMWRLTPVRGGTRVVFAQDVEARGRLLRLLSPLLHHRLAGQHSAVMRGAADGMRRSLQGADDAPERP